jgi:hypothetical protein
VAGSKDKSKGEKKANAPRKPSWREQFEQLVAFKRVHGHCNVPKRQGSLGFWVQRQRAQKRKLDENRCLTTALWVKREKKLASIGFEWGRRRVAVSWEQRFQELVDYKRVHGDIHVPSWKENTLSRWINEQRYVYRQKEKGERTAMTVERQKKLESIGFVWRSK